MNWRDILEGGGLNQKPYTHNTHKYPESVNCADIADIAYSKTESEAALQAFVGLVRIAAACDHHVLLHRDAIAAALDESDKSELLTNTREDRQTWAAMLAYRLTRSRIHE